MFHKFSCVFQSSSLCVFDILAQQNVFFFHFVTIHKHTSNIKSKKRRRRIDVIQASFNSDAKPQVIEKQNQTILKSLQN